MKKKFNYFFLLWCLGGLTACHYLPMLTYFSQHKDTDLPTFSKKVVFAGSINEYRAYDILVYDWFVRIDPEKERIAGTMTLDFKFVSSVDVIMLDLQRRLKVNEIRSAFPIRHWKHKGDLLYIYFEHKGDTEQEVSIVINYEGKPAILAKEGPIQWKADKNGNPWISTQTEGVGAHFMMPCKELLYDEPAQCFIRVSVPEDLKVVANGSLDSITADGENRVFHHSLQNPINIYNISFNIGQYESYTEKYRDVSGQSRAIEVHALAFELDSAKKIYKQTPMHVEVLEQIYGPFPWWGDGCKIVQTTLSGGAMEHQSAISMGAYLYNDFQPKGDTLHVNTTLIHELAHEWWGNQVSGFDYCDMWIHEGMATFSEAMVIERLYEPKYYDYYIRWLAGNIVNQRPILKTCDVRYNSWVSYKDSDIYNKGALLIHTMRRQLDDDTLFFGILREALVAFDRQNVTTEQLVNYFNEQTELDLIALFDLYLKHAQPPKLLYSYDRLSGHVAYRWAKPLATDFSFRVDMSTDSSVTALYPSTTEQVVPATNSPTFDVARFGYVLIQEIAVD